MHGRKGGLVRDSIADIESFRPASPGWPASIGMGGRLPSESMAGLHRNQWPLCVGLRSRAPQTVLSKLLKALIDPNTAPVRALSREQRELMIAANNSYLLAFDNLSGVPDWLSANIT